MTIEGPLKELDIHDVFQLLDLGRKTGVLRISSDRRRNAGTVYFDSGAVVAADILSNPHLLGKLAMRAGKLTEEDLARARAMQESGDSRRLGDILVDIGAVGRRELDRLMRTQIEEVIFELTSWSEGYFSFEEGSGNCPAEALVRIRTEALLMEAARRIDEWSRIETKVRHLGVVPTLVAADGAEAGTLDLAPLEWAVLAAVDGVHDVRAIADGLARPEFDVARTLFGLSCAGIILLHDPGVPGDATPERRDPVTLVAHARDLLELGDAISARLAAEEALVLCPTLALAHLVRGRALHASGRYEEAEEAMLEALRLEQGLAAAHRWLGVSRAARGRFADAMETWDRWRALPARPLEEEALTPAVDRLRAAALTLSDAVRGRHE